MRASAERRRQLVGWLRAIEYSSARSAAEYGGAALEPTKRGAVFGRGSPES
jgi:hypothetical protein